MMDTSLQLNCRPPSDSRSSNCLFEEDWWLEAVSPGAWGAVEVRDGGRVHARLTFGLGRVLGQVALRQPPLTQTLGPWYYDTGAKSSNRLEREKNLAQELIHQLPAHSFFSINFHRSVTNWLPFFWKGFRAVPKFTYVLHDLSDENLLWNGLKENIRREVRKARKQVEVQATDDVDLFIALHQKTFDRQRSVMPHSVDTVRRLDAACAARGARRIYVARDEQGRPHAAVYVVFDDRCCYYLMGGGDPMLRKSGAGSLLIWQSILDAGSASGEFDFEGSMAEPIERFFRSFGASQSSYFNLRRSNRWIGATEGLRHTWQSLTAQG